MEIFLDLNSWFFFLIWCFRFSCPFCVCFLIILWKRPVLIWKGLIIRDFFFSCCLYFVLSKAPFLPIWQQLAGFGGVAALCCFLTRPKHQSLSYFIRVLDAWFSLCCVVQDNKAMNMFGMDHMLKDGWSGRYSQGYMYFDNCSSLFLPKVQVSPFAWVSSVCGHLWINALFSFTHRPFPLHLTGLLHRLQPLPAPQQPKGQSSSDPSWGKKRLIFNVMPHFCVLCRASRPIRAWFGPTSR